MGCCFEGAARHPAACLGARCGAVHGAFWLRAPGMLAPLPLVALVVGCSARRRFGFRFVPLPLVALARWRRAVPEPDWFFRIPDSARILNSGMVLFAG